MNVKLHTGLLELAVGDGHADACSEACRVCHLPSAPIFQLEVLGRLVRYFECASCGYLQTESPFWLEEAYGSAINDVDTGILWRSKLNVARVVLTLAAMKEIHGKVVDFAGGYGLLVRSLRDVGVDAWWHDKYCPNLVARGFEAQDLRSSLITAFEVFEHFVDPVTELRTLLSSAPAVLLSTELIQTDAAPPPDWWYFGPEHGQHIGFFRTSTLQRMAEKLGCHVETDGKFLHLFSTRPIPRFWKALQHMRFCYPAICKLALTSRMRSDFDLLRR